MQALWAAPPAVLIAGTAAVLVQLRRIAAQRAAVADAARNFVSDQAGVRRLREATERARGSLDGLERR